MHSNIFKILFFTVMFGAVVGSVNAQYYEAGLGIGLIAYWGDLNAPDNTKNYTNAKVGVNGFFQLNFNGYVNARLSLMHGNLRGDDSRSRLSWQNNRNLSFKSTYSEFSILGSFNFLKYDADDGSHLFTPYFTAGVSGFYFNPKALYNGQYYDLQPLGTEGQGLSGYDNKYNLLSTSIVFGGGIKIKLTENLNLMTELLVRRTFTDYLDDVSSNYADYDDLYATNGELSALLANRANELDGNEGVQLIGQRGGKEVNDYVISGMLTISYNFVGRKAFKIFNRNKGVDCPKY